MPASDAAREVRLGIKKVTSLSESGEGFRQVTIQFLRQA